MVRRALHLRFETVPEDVQLSRVFAGLQRIPKDIQTPLKAVSKDFYESQKATFRAEGAFEGKDRWQPLSPDYARDKAKLFPGKPILVRTGKLQAAATSKAALGSVYSLGRQELVMGVDITVKGGWNLGFLHQAGTAFMPRRAIIQLSMPQRLRWVRIFRDWLGGSINRAVGQPRKFAPGVTPVVRNL